MNEKMKKIRDKVEDGIVKAYRWSTEHPILTKVIIAGVGAGVSGAVAYKAGYSRGDSFARKDIGRRIQDGTDFVTLHCAEDGAYYDNELLDAHDLVKETSNAARSNLLLGAMAMKLESGNGAFVWASADNRVDVFALEEPDVVRALAEDVKEVVNKA